MSALLLKLGECERQGNHRTWWDTGVLDLLDVSEERDVRAYEMGRLKSDDSNLKEGIGFKMESLKTFGYKYQPDTLGFTVKTRSRQTPAMTLWGLQRLLLIFSGLFPSHPQKNQLQHPLWDFKTTARCPRCCWSSQEMRRCVEPPPMMGTGVLCVRFHQPGVSENELTHDKCGSLYLRIQSSKMELNSRWKS